MFNRPEERYDKVGRVNRVSRYDQIERRTEQLNSTSGVRVLSCVVNRSCSSDSYITRARVRCGGPCDALRVTPIPFFRRDGPIECTYLDCAKKTRWGSGIGIVAGSIPGVALDIGTEDGVDYGWCICCEDGPALRGKYESMIQEVEIPVLQFRRFSSL